MPQFDLWRGVLVKNAMNDGIAWVNVGGQRFGFLGTPGLSILSRGHLFISPDAQAETLDELQRLSCSCFVTLLEEEELPEGEFESLCAAISQAGFAHIHFPIPDYSVPNVQGLQPIVEKVRGYLERQEAVVFCCLAGLGRSGFMAAVLLMHLGYQAHEAIDRIRLERPDAIESDEQIAFIEAYRPSTD